jgi:hypothetical protein
MEERGWSSSNKNVENKDGRTQGLFVRRKKAASLSASNRRSCCDKKS